MTGMDYVKARSAVLDKLEEECRVRMRVTFPQLPGQPDEGVVFRPPPKPPKPRQYVCPICDFTTELKYQMQIHVMSGTEVCSRRGKRKERNWASRT